MILRPLPALAVAAWSPNRERLAGVTKDEKLILWPVDPALPPLLVGQVSDADLLIWSPSGRRLPTTSRDRVVRLWYTDGAVPIAEAARGQDGRFSSMDAVIRLKGHGDTITAAAWSPDGSRVLTGSADNTVRVWSSNGDGEPVVLHGPTAPITAVTWKPNGERVAAASEDDTVHIEDRKNERHGRSHTRPAYTRFGSRRQRTRRGKRDDRGETGRWRAAPPASPAYARAQAPWSSRPAPGRGGPVDRSRLRAMVNAAGAPPSSSSPTRWPGRPAPSTCGRPSCSSASTWGCASASTWAPAPTGG